MKVFTLRVLYRSPSSDATETLDFPIEAAVLPFAQGEVFPLISTLFDDISEVITTELFGPSGALLLWSDMIYKSGVISWMAPVTDYGTWRIHDAIRADLEGHSGSSAKPPKDSTAAFYHRRASAFAHHLDKTKSVTALVPA